MFEVLVAFKQRRCFSPRAGVCVVEMRGVGRFQTAKVFLLVAKSYRGTRSATGVDRFQTAKVFLLIATSCAVNWVRVLVAFKQRRCFSKKEYSSVRQHRGVGRFQTAKVFLRKSSRRCRRTIRGVGRFQTAKVFLLIVCITGFELGYMVLVAFKQRRCFSVIRQIKV